MIPTEIQLPVEVAHARLLSDRRGCKLWHVALADDRQLALKYATGRADVLVLREEAVMRRLGMAGRIAYSGLTSGGGAWLASQWLHSPTIYELWRGIRKGDGRHERASAVEAAYKAAVSLQALHRIGWRHADLQPDHILCPQTGPAQLLDYALAQGPEDIAPSVTYRGGLAHLAAPEVAAEILATEEDHHVCVTSAGEVYMFGAILYTAMTGQWPTQYDTEHPSPTQVYESVADPARRKPSPEKWPRMTAVIREMMAYEPMQRPTAADVVGLMPSMT